MIRLSEGLHCGAKDTKKGSQASKSGSKSDASASQEEEKDMFKRIMAPVDLAHSERLEGALECAADLAKHYNVPITYVGVTSSAPSQLAHNPEEFGRKLGEFAEAEAAKYGVQSSAHTAIAHDPTTEIDDALMRAIDDTGSDLVVMASHVPHLMDHVWPSNGGKLAEHARCSVMVVRP